MRTFLELSEDEVVQLRELAKDFGFRITDTMVTRLKTAGEFNGVLWARIAQAEREPTDGRDEQAGHV